MRRDMPYVSIKIDSTLHLALKSLAYPGESLSHALARLLPAMQRENNYQGKALARSAKYRGSEKEVISG